MRLRLEKIKRITSTKDLETLSQGEIIRTNHGDLVFFGYDKYYNNVVDWKLELIERVDGEIRTIKVTLNHVGIRYSGAIEFGTYTESSLGPNGIWRDHKIIEEYKSKDNFLKTLDLKEL